MESKLKNIKSSSFQLLGKFQMGNIILDYLHKYLHTPSHKEKTFGHINKYYIFFVKSRHLMVLCP